MGSTHLARIAACGAWLLGAVVVSAQEQVPGGHGLGAWHARGFRGQGVRVGILDRGFDEFYVRVRAPARRISEDAGTGAHGTACAEVLRAVAPEATIVVYAIPEDAGAVSWKQGVEALLAERVDILSVSIGQVMGGPMDGRGAIDDLVALAYKRGVIWVNAAGNGAIQQHVLYFADRNGNGFHEFVPSPSQVGDPRPFGQSRIQELMGRVTKITSDEVLTLEVEEGPGWVGLVWDDWGEKPDSPRPLSDLDLHLVADRGVYFERGSKRSVALASDGRQAGREWARPTERIEYVARREKAGAGRLRLGILIGRQAGDIPRARLIVHEGHPLPAAWQEPRGSLMIPADSRYALTVGALQPLADGGFGPAPFSARGPTGDGRLKPDLVVPTGVQVLSFPQVFQGTSPGAPIVAGILALLKQAHPAAGAEELRMRLLERTRHVPGTSPDVVGHGRLVLEPPP